MKDLIQEGRRIQETFKKNVMQGSKHINEFNTFQKFKRFSPADHNVQIIARSEAGSGTVPPEKNHTNAQDVTNNICSKILVGEYKFVESTTDQTRKLGIWPNEQLYKKYPVYLVQFEDSSRYVYDSGAGKNIDYTDGNIKKMVDECANEISKELLSKTNGRKYAGIAVVIEAMGFYRNTPYQIHEKKIDAIPLIDGEK